MLECKLGVLSREMAEYGSRGGRQPRLKHEDIMNSLKTKSDSGPRDI